MKRITPWVAVCAALLSQATVEAAIQYNVGVTPTFFNGSGNTNAGFAVDTVGNVVSPTTGPNIELALRAQTRYPSPSDSPAGIMHQGNGIYGAFDAVGYTSAGATPGPRGSWNFNWSVNVGPGTALSRYDYELGIDYNPASTVNPADFVTFDLINSGISTDTSLGNNSTTDLNETVDSANYLTNISNGAYNVAQNSWNLAFFSVLSSLGYDPTADGTYDIYLHAIDRATGGLLAATEIQVIVGAGGTDAVVPEATTMLMWSGLALCGGVLAWRKKARA